MISEMTDKNQRLQSLKSVAVEYSTAPWEGGEREGDCKAETTNHFAPCKSFPQRNFLYKAMTTMCLVKDFYARKTDF